MRKFTKGLMTLALLCIVGVASAKETVVYSLDYSTQADKDGAPFWAGDMPDGASVKVDGGLLVIDNTSDNGEMYSLQLWIGTGITTESGNDYKVKIEYKSTVAGGVWLGLGGWSDRPTNYGAAVEKTDEFKTLEIDFTDYAKDASDNFVMWQSRKLVGTVYIKKVEVIEIAPDGPVVEPTFVSVINNGDLEGDDASCFSLTQAGVGGSWIATIEEGIGKDGSRGIKVVSCDQADIPACQLNPADANSYQWATQFFISSKYKIPSGKKIRLKFDYRADVVGDADVQAHGAPGAYNHWQFTGGCSFTDEWQTYDKTVTLTSDMSKSGNLFYTAAFNLGKNTKATTFYFDNIVMEAGVFDTETLDGFEASPAVRATPNPSIEIGENGVATFVADYSVKLDDNVTAYAAVYDKTNNSVTLTKVTEIPLHTPIIVEAASGTYPEELARVLALGTDNDLQESDGKVAGDGTIYVLAKGNSGVGFYKLAADEKVPSGKGYLKIAAADAAPEFIGLNGSTTAIKAIEKAVDNGAIFNLAGQRVEQATKGLYIVNGKKVILK